MYVDDDFIEEMYNDDQNDDESDFKTMKESELDEDEEYNEGDIIDLNQAL